MSNSGRILLKCALCPFKTINYKTKWLEHLLEESHQLRTRKASSDSTLSSEKRLKKNRRSVVVFGIRGLQLRDVLTHFSSKNVVTDFIFWNESPDICLVQFQIVLSGALRTLANETKSIGGQEVFVRLRRNISELEWRYIWPAETNRARNDNRRTKIKEEPDDSDDCVILDDENSTTIKNEFQTKNATTGSISNEQDKELDTESSDSSFSSDSESIPTLPTGNCPQKATAIVNVKDSVESNNIKGSDSLWNSETISRKWKNYCSLIPKKQLCLHNLYMRPSQQFSMEAMELMKKANIEEGDNAWLHIHNCWVNLILQFNALVWENLFGIKLYRGTDPAVRNFKVNNCEKYRKRASQFIGILTSMDKIQNWITLTNCTNHKEINKQRDNYFKALTNGSLTPKPPTCSTEDVSEMFSSKLLLGFEANILGRPSSSRRGYQATVVLQFKNVVCSGTVDYSRFLQIIKMYDDIWQMYFCSQVHIVTKQ